MLGTLYDLEWNSAPGSYWLGAIAAKIPVHTGKTRRLSGA